MSARYKRVTIHTHDVAWAEKAIYDTETNRVAPFGVENKDDLTDVIEFLEIYGAESYRWLDADKVRIERYHEEVPGA